MAGYLKVSVTYGSEEYEGFKPIFKFIKIFIFKKLPCVPSYIKLPSKLFPTVHFKNPLYDPEIDQYIISCKSCFMLHRYYHCDRMKTAEEYTSKFKKEGWEVVKL